MLHVLHTKTPFQADVFERHANVTTVAQAKKVLSQWMESDDSIEVWETQPTGKPGWFITPVVVVTPYGEPLDIFGQLFTQEPPR